ncbi:unnamed protein product [Echinostoma caproni]|uniref:DUF1618 domain-containing protein n=1 Tax=Echinostoma caproni TaxID=27848 RepID=A0A183AHB1_9TREM|nr:unnamed protein product [Echinostoma caproni]
MFRFPWILTNGAMGDLQLINLDTGRLTVDKLDVTRQSTVPRASGSGIPVVYNEVLLFAAVTSDRHGSWLVTYERMIPCRGKSVVDDQARIIWWKWTQPNVDSLPPRFEPLESYSLSHLNCRGTDLGYVEDSDLYTYLLLADMRLMIWRYEKNKGLRTVLAPLILKRSKKCSKGLELKLASLLTELHPVCCRAHPTKPWLAIGLVSGQATILQIEHSMGKKISFCPIYTLPQISAHPLCDRRASHRGGTNRRHSNVQTVGSGTCPATTTKLLTLEFLPSVHSTAYSEVRLVGLVETIIGRERGRRDLIVYGTSPGASHQVTENVISKVTQAANVLQFADPAPTTCLPQIQSPLAGRKRVADRTDSEIVDALRQVSQYPLLTAPAPEQLLRQLMSKPTHAE